MNQRLKKCVRCVLLPYNWLRVFRLTAYYRHGHNLVLLNFTVKHPEPKFKFCLASDRYQHVIEAKWVSQSKTVAKA